MTDHLGAEPGAVVGRLVTLLGGELIGCHVGHGLRLEQSPAGCLAVGEQHAPERDQVSSGRDQPCRAGPEEWRVDQDPPVGALDELQRGDGDELLTPLGCQQFDQLASLLRQASSHSRARI